MGVAPSSEREILQQPEKTSPSSTVPGGQTLTSELTSPQPHRKRLNTASIRKESTRVPINRRQPISLSSIDGGGELTENNKREKQPTPATQQRPSGGGSGKNDGIITMRNKGLERVPPEVLAATNANTLYLDTNKFTEIPGDIASFASLTALSLANNQLSSLPDEVWTIPTLTFLNLSRNKFTSVPKEIGLAKSLKFLFMDKNQLVELPPSISSVTTLKIMSFKDNLFVDVPPLPLVYAPLGTDSDDQENKEKEDESEKEKEKEKEIVAAIPQVNPGLDVLDIRGNPIMQNFKLIKEEYLLHAGLHVSLTYLNISRNGIDVLPEALSQLQNLKKLKVSFNFISTFPKGCDNWFYLSKLKMNCNDFTEVPEELLSLPRLTKVNMCGNPFIIPPMKNLDLKAYKKLTIEEKIEAWEKQDPEYLKDGRIERLEERLCICRHIPAASDIPDRILPKLYLGSQTCALNRHILKRLGITHILTLLDMRPAYPETFKYKMFPVIDKRSENLMQYFEDCNLFINEGRGKRKAILVHCRAGVSRSATVCIAYLMRHRKLELGQAVEYVRQRRPIINPNPGFRVQLKKYQNFVNLNTALPF